MPAMSLGVSVCLGSCISFGIGAAFFSSASGLVGVSPDPVRSFFLHYPQDPLKLAQTLDRTGL